MNRVTVLPTLHCIAMIFSECKAFYLAFSSQFLYLSGTINRDRTMNSGANELQIGQLLLCCVTDGTSSSAMLLTGLGPGSDVIIFIDTVNIVATVCHAICYGNESYKIW